MKPPEEARRLCSRSACRLWKCSSGNSFLGFRHPVKISGQRERHGEMPVPPQRAEHLCFKGGRGWRCIFNALSFTEVIGTADFSDWLQKSLFLIQTGDLRDVTGLAVASPLHTAEHIYYNQAVPWKGLFLFCVSQTTDVKFFIMVVSWDIQHENYQHQKLHRDVSLRTWNNGEDRFLCDLKH